MCYKCKRFPYSLNTLKSSSFCNSSFFYLHFGLRLPFYAGSLHLKMSALKEVCTWRSFRAAPWCSIPQNKFCPNKIPHHIFDTVQLHDLVTSPTKHTCHHTCIDGTCQCLLPSKISPLTLLAVLLILLNAICLTFAVHMCQHVPYMG
jgi:hypothetical protein